MGNICLLKIVSTEAFYRIFLLRSGKAKFYEVLFASFSHPEQWEQISLL